MTLASTNPLDDLLTTGELCAWLNISRETVYTHRKRGTGPDAYNMGRGLRFKRRDVLEWLESRRDSA